MESEGFSSHSLPRNLFSQFLQMYWVDSNVSSAELRRFKNQLELLSYTEQLAVIEYLAQLLQRNHEPASMDDRIPESE